MENLIKKLKELPKSEKGMRLIIGGIFTIILIATLVTIGIRENTKKNVLAIQQQQANEQKIKEDADAKAKKQNTYSKLLDSGKTYENLSEDERKTFSDLISDWGNEDSEFKSKYGTEKDTLSKSQSDYLAKVKAEADAKAAQAKADKKVTQENNKSSQSVTTNTNNIPKSVASSYKAKFGQILEANQLGNNLTIKFKIEPSSSNKLTIDKNGFNVEDLITNQGCDQFDQINYWAVADMTDGSESKVISYTLNKDLIQKIKDKKVFGQQIASMADSVWILPTLKK